MRVASVFGAGGGIGHAVVARFAQSGHYARIHAGSRQPCGGFGPMVSPFTFDLTDENSMADASAPFQGGRTSPAGVQDPDRR